ncbi:MAG: tail fiber domain-containing protein [Planctomycetota bacterium]|jgi:hypothetical protein
MKTKKNSALLLVMLAVAVGWTKVSEAEPMGTAFTYQGLLKYHGDYADGFYDFKFELYDTNSDGNQVGSTIDMVDVNVVDGHFRVDLDFGGVFSGNAVWLEVHVGPISPLDPNLVRLEPRVELTPTPYALYAASGASPGVPLTLSGSRPGGHIIRGSNSSTESLSVGVVGRATGVGGSTFGVRGESDSPNGTGVYGEASDTGIGTNHGGYFVAEGMPGRGVYAEATGLSATGVRGVASNVGDGINYGGYFTAEGSGGMGVRASAGNNGYDVTNYGGYFTAGGSAGRGVYAKATHTADVTNYGAYFEAAGSTGRAVYGEAGNTGTAINYGGYFKAAGSAGRGVYGEAADSGAATNYGGYFEAKGRSGRGVRGYASNSGGATNYGGYFTAMGSSGRGVYGVASGSSGRGVQGNGGDYDFYASGPGTNYGATSSVRWKSDIRAIDDPLGKVVRLRGVYFNWDAEHGGGHDVGMIAEEVGQVLPEIVQYEEDGIYTTGMDYSKLTPLLVEAVKALKAEVDEQQKRVIEQDAVIEGLQEEVAELTNLIKEELLNRNGNFTEGAK